MDIKSKDILKQALKAYDGTLIVVSHDRDFLEGLVDKMYEFRDGRVKEYLGSVSDFLEKRKLDSLQELERRFGSSKGTDNQEKKVAAQQSFEQKKSVSKEERRVRHRIDFLEKEIAGIEEKMAAIEAVLSNPSEKDDVLELTRSYLELKRECEGKTEEWASLMESL